MTTPKHQARIRTLGDLLEVISIDENGCWNYLNGRAPYKRIYELLVRPVEDGLQLNHTCDNRQCVNVFDHLYQGTQKDNVQDAVQRGHHIRGEKHKLAKLTECEVLLAREFYQTAGLPPKTAAKIIAEIIHKPVPCIYNAIRRISWRHI